jgi:hypothetical protein
MSAGGHVSLAWFTGDYVDDVVEEKGIAVLTSKVLQTSSVLGRGEVKPA